MKYNRVKLIFEKGLIYGLGRDRRMRPIIVFNARKTLDSREESGLDETDFEIAFEIMRNYVQY